MAARKKAPQRGRPTNQQRGIESCTERVSVPMTTELKMQAAALAELLHDQGTAALLRRLLAREVRRHKARLPDT